MQRKLFAKYSSLKKYSFTKEDFIELFMIIMAASAFLLIR